MKFQLSTLTTLCAVSLATSRATEERSEERILATNGNDAFVPTKILRSRHAHQEARLGVGKVLKNVKKSAALGSNGESSQKGQIEDLSAEDRSDELVGDLGILDKNYQTTSLVNDRNLQEQGSSDDNFTPTPTSAPTVAIPCEEYCAQFGERPLIPQNDISFRSKVWGYLFPNYESEFQDQIAEKENDSDRLLEPRINPYSDVPIGCWNTSQITEMKSAFDAPESYIVDGTGDDDFRPVDFLNPFNKRLCWDTKQVTNMENMFNRCNQFNQPLDSFDTSSVTSMARMFNDAQQFNQPLSSFNTSAVTDMSSMFAIPDPRDFGGMGQFNQPLSSFDTSAVTDMSSMFSNTVFNQPLDSFNTSSVTSMAGMFANERSSRYTASSAFNQPLSSWDTSAVEDMSSMFRYSRGFNQPLAFDTSSVKTMELMFEGAYQFDSTIDFDTSKVSNMRGMFSIARQFNQPVSNFDTSSVTRMDIMFSRASNFDQPVPFDTSKVDKFGLQYMFHSASSFNQNLDTFDTSSVTDMSGMFRNAISFDQSLSSFDTSRVKDMRGMFANATVFNQDLSNFNTNKAEDMKEMFDGAINFNQPLTNFKTSKVYSMEAMFKGASVFDQPLDNFDTFNVRDFTFMFEGAVAFNQPLEGVFDTRTADETTAMFRNAKAFNQPLDSWNLAGVTRLASMFENATSFNQCISSWQKRFIFGGSNKIKDMFKGSACPNQSDPIRLEGPWCQTSETCASASCDDEPKTIKFDYEPDTRNDSKPKIGKNCKFISRMLNKNGTSGRRKKRLCKTKAKVQGREGPKVKISELCPRSCNLCSDDCKDSTRRFDIPSERVGNTACRFAKNWVTNSNRVRLCSRTKIRLKSGRKSTFKAECPEICGKIGYGRCAALFN